MDILNAARSENLQWKKAKQSEALALRKSKALAQQSLRAELKRNQVRFEHECTVMKQGFEADIAMQKAQCSQNVRDYKHYLDSIDQLKVLIQTSFSHLPDAVSLTIHHHAKQMLNQMWASDEIKQKIKFEEQLIQLMTAVHQDTLEPSVEFPEHPALPVRTLKMINSR